MPLAKALVHDGGTEGRRAFDGLVRLFENMDAWPLLHGVAIRGRIHRPCFLPEREEQSLSEPLSPTMFLAPDSVRTIKSAGGVK
jgi:hypothetical protein